MLLFKCLYKKINTAPYHQRKIMHQQMNWAQSWTIVSWQSKALVAFIAKDMQCVTHPQSPTRDARGGSRGWWEGRRGEDSLLCFPPSHHTPSATRRGCYRWLETSQMLCFLTFASSYIAWPCPICFTWPHSWPNQSMSLVTSNNSLRTVGGSTWKRSYGAINRGLKDRARPFCGNKNKIL